MGLATLAVTDVSHGTDQADGWALEGPAPAGSETGAWASEASDSAKAEASGSPSGRGTSAEVATAAATHWGPGCAEIKLEHSTGDDTPGSDDAAADAELDVLLELGDEIATLAAHLHAATYRLLTLIAEFDRLRGWEPGGHRSCVHWLAFRTGIDLGAAREKVRAARALSELPQISASMARG